MDKNEFFTIKQNTQVSYPANEVHREVSGIPDEAVLNSDMDPEISPARMMTARGVSLVTC